MLKNQPCSDQAPLCGPLRSFICFDNCCMDESQIYVLGSDTSRLQTHISTWLRAICHSDKCYHLKFNLFKTKLILSLVNMVSHPLIFCYFSD